MRKQVHKAVFAEVFVFSGEEWKGLFLLGGRRILNITRSAERTSLLLDSILEKKEASPYIL